MEVIVHGTIGGYKSPLNKTQDTLKVSFDIRNNSESEVILGKSFYALGFTTNGFVFTKYKIITDTPRKSSMGFIAFTIFSPIDKKIHGEDIKAILDEMLSYYENNYIVNNKINRGEITPLIHVDWSFINEVTNKYKEHPQLLDFELKPGEKEAAYILYKDEDDLIKYFSRPYQEEYINFKQVFLLNKDDNYISDLLEFIKNSGIELKGIDLNNDYFILANYEPHRNVIIKANGKKLSNQKNSNIIRANDLLEIDFKINNFFKEIHSEGKLSDAGNEIRKYLDISDKQIKIKYYAFIPDPITKTIKIQITDPNGYIIENAEIFYKSNYGREEKATKNQITFKGEDLGKNWTVVAKMGNYKGTASLAPNNYNDGQTLQINLKEEIKNVELKNDKKPRYKIEPGTKGTLLKENCFSAKGDGSDINVKELIKFKIGWKFNGFKKEEHEDKSFDGALIAQYKRDYKPLIYTASIILPLVIVASLFLFGGPSSDDINQAQSLQKNIEVYVNSNELFISRLNDFDAKWKSEKPNESKAFFDFFKRQTNPITDDTWNKVNEKIKCAIEKRNLINSLSIDELKNREYSLEQKEFEETIKQVDSAGQVLLLDSLDNNSIAKMNLDQIAKSIQNTLGLQTKIIEDITGSDREDTVEITTTKNESNVPTQTETPGAERQPAADKNISPNKEIIEKLKGGDISKLGLDDLKIGVTDSRLKNSIELYIKFWGIVESTNQDDYNKLFNEIKGDFYLKDSELKIFLAHLENQFEEYKNIRGRSSPRTTINEIKKKMK